MFFVYKIYGRFKSIGFVDGSKQIEKISKEYAASPDLFLKSIVIMSAIEDYKEHDVATIDIPGKYLHTKNYKYVIMLLRVRLMYLMAVLDPKLYQRYATTEKNGQILLYVNIINMFQGIFRSAQLFYNNLVKIWNIMDSRPTHIIHP